MESTMSYLLRCLRWKQQGLGREDGQRRDYLATPGDLLIWSQPFRVAQDVAELLCGIDMTPGSRHGQ